MPPFLRAPRSCLNVNTPTNRIPPADWTWGQPWILPDGANNQGDGGYNCSTTVGGTGNTKSPQYGPAPAYQVSNVPTQRWDYCHRLGSTIQPGGYANVNYKLIDTSNPSRGVGIQYTGGDQCGPDAPTTPRRSLTIWLQCDEDASGTISSQEVVLEQAPPAGSPAGTASCQYEIFLKTAYGCPFECPVGPDPNTGANKLCSNHGFCDFDTSAAQPKCFCNDGWTGVDCATRSAVAPSGLSATGGVLITVCLFLVGTLAFLGFLWYRIRSLRLDPAAYSALRSGPAFTASDGNVQESS